MVAINFSVFKDKVLSGKKRQTIRLCKCEYKVDSDSLKVTRLKKCRWHSLKKGDKLHLFWRQRRKDCEKLLEATCERVYSIHMGFKRDENEEYGTYWVKYQGKRLSDAAIGRLARRDGFKNSYELFRWFDAQYCLNKPKEFRVISWV